MEMTFVQLMVLLIIACLTIVHCVTMIVSAKIKRSPGKDAILESAAAAMAQADESGAVVSMLFTAEGASIKYIPEGSAECLNTEQK